ncbi:MAG TPA: hypothetical protein DD490_24095 [Acidobacteria bacterium]|nr:hypothetical protein [Acidobacteriota bacterium]
MNKDNLIAAVFGILLGFIAGYLLHEVMASRQPPRFAAAAPGVAGTPGAAPPAAAAPQSGGSPDLAAAQAAQQEMQQLEQFVQENPDNPEALRRLADLNFDQQRWSQARGLYERFLKLKPDDVGVISDLGVVYRGLGLHQEALNQFDEAQRLEPGHWQSRFNKAIVFGFDLKQYDDAQRELAELQKLQPGNPDVARLAAEIEKAKGAPPA